MARQVECFGGLCWRLPLWTFGIAIALSSDLHSFGRYVGAGIQMFAIGHYCARPVLYRRRAS